MDSVRVPPQVFALDERQISYLGLEEGGELYCRECAREPVSDDCFQPGPLGGRIRDAETFSGSLDALLAQVGKRPTEASLVVPDNWLRLTFIETEEWPRRRDEQMGVLRFKLGRIVPFRVEELRIAAERVPVLEGGGGHRFLVGFGIDSVFRQIEDAFRARGVRIGSLSNSSLSLLQALREGLEPAALAVVLLLSDERYGLMVTRNAVPVVYRGKSHSPGTSISTVSRELRLTKNFLQERLPPGIVSDIVLVAPESREPEWRRVLEETFERPVSSLTQEWSSIPGLTTLDTHDAAPLVGAALCEVA